MRRKKCRLGHHVDRLMRGGKRVQCIACGDEFPCKACEKHFDCAAVRDGSMTLEEATGVKP